MELGDWFICILAWLKKKSVPLFIIILLLMGYLGIQIYVSLDPTKIVKVQTQAVIPETRPDNKKNELQENRTISRKTEPNKEQEVGDKKEVHHPSNFNSTISILKERLKSEGMDPRLAELVMTEINSYMHEKHDKYDFNIPIKKVLGDQASEEEIAHLNSLVIESSVQSHDEGVARGEFPDVTFPKD